MSELGSGPRKSVWLNWEWRAAIITLVAVAIVIGGIFGYQAYRKAQLQHQRDAAIAAARQRQIALIKTAFGVCQLSLKSAKALNVVPQYTNLVRALPIATRRTGRYVCVAGTNVGHYNLVIDLLCKQVTQSKCVGLVAVVQDDGTMLYRYHAK
jgi:hypothetical protein